MKFLLAKQNQGRQRVEAEEFGCMRMGYGIDRDEARTTTLLTSQPVKMRAKSLARRAPWRQPVNPDVAKLRV